jgi:hypothetical protein
MTGKFSDKPGPLPTSVDGYRQNYQLSAICSGSGRNRRRNFAYLQQIVRCGSEGEHPGHPLGSNVSGFPKVADGLHSAEDFLHPFAQALTGGITLMVNGPGANDRLPARAILGHMRHGIQGAELGQTPEYHTLYHHPP